MERAYLYLGFFLLALLPISIAYGRCCRARSGALISSLSLTVRPAIGRDQPFKNDFGRKSCADGRAR